MSGDDKEMTVQRDRLAEQAELSRRAGEIPGVAEVTRIYSAYQQTVAQVAALTQVPAPTSSSAAGTAW